MNAIDIIIILLCITAILRGIDRGLVRQACSTAGLVAGFFTGAFIQGKLVHLAGSPSHKAMLAVVIILTSVIILSSAGEYIGNVLKAKIEENHLRTINSADRGSGAVLGGTTVLFAVWLAASVFSGVPVAGLQKELKSSFIIAQLNHTLPDAPGVVAKLSHLIDPNSFPDVFAGLEPTIDTSAPLPSIGELDAGVRVARASTVKVQGDGCGGISTGSGFVAEAGYIITNAHVIAGVGEPYVIDANGRHRTQVLWFDPDLDLAVLRASDLAGAPLDMITDITPDNTPGAALGYPGGGDFTAEPATVMDAFTAVGRDIYNQRTTKRAVYSLKADIQPGNSGGPLINEEGDVIGVIFAESTTYDNVGYALAMEDVIAGFNQAKDRNQTVRTGSCAS